MKKFESTNMGLAHFKILIFSDFSSMGVGLEKKIKFCHPLQVANFSIFFFFFFFFFFVQNSLRCINIMTFEGILSVFLFKTGMFQRI